MNKYTTQYRYNHLLERATDEAGNLTALARRTGISRRRLGKIKAGSPASRLEERIMQWVIARKV